MDTPAAWRRRSACAAVASLDAGQRFVQRVRRRPIRECIDDIFLRPIAADLIRNDADAAACHDRAAELRERDCARAIGPGPCVRRPAPATLRRCRARASMPSSSRFQNASLLPITVSANGRVNLNASLAWRASQWSRPMIPRDSFCLLAAGDRFDQCQRHRHRGSDSGRRHDAADRRPSAGSARTASTDASRAVPSERTSASCRACCRAVRPPRRPSRRRRRRSQSRLSRTDLDPLQRRGIVVAAHRGHDDVVGAVGMTRIELGDRRCPARPSAQDRASRDRDPSRPSTLSHVRAPQDSRRHDVVGGLGRVVDADDCDHRSLHASVA